MFIHQPDVDNLTDKGLMLALHHICRHAHDAYTAKRRPKKLIVMYQMMNQKTYHIWQKNKSAMHEILFHSITTNIRFYLVTVSVFMGQTPSSD